MSGIFGIVSKGDCKDILLTGLFSLQHRGENFCGVVTLNNKRLYSSRYEGMVLDKTFVKRVRKLQGNKGIGNVHPLFKQPISFKSKLGELAIVYDGKILNKKSLTNKLMMRGHSLSIKHSDVEIIGKLITEGKEINNIAEGIERMAEQVKGVYSLGILGGGGLYVFRSPISVEPLVVGENETMRAFASESCSLKESLGLRNYDIKNVKPGEIIFIDNSIETIKQLKGVESLCGFEPGYWARIDSYFEGIAVKAVREKCGRILGEQDKKRGFKTDIVIPVRDSGVGYAIGYSHGSKVLYDEGLFKNWYITRTFLDPTKSGRIRGVNRKQSVVEEAIEGKIIVLVDDSIREGKTLRNKLIPLLRGGGAKEIHVRIGSPENEYLCKYNIFPKSRGTLLAKGKSLEEQREYLGADSLEYINLEDYVVALGRTSENTCLGCWNNKFPI